MLSDAMYSSAAAEWYTPKLYVDAAWAVMGGIDLDPASCDEAQRTVQAARYYTPADDGLWQPWSGRVWLNPPYGDQIGRWTLRLRGEYASGRIEQAIALLPARTDTSWFQPLFDFPCCFVRGRIKFGNAANSAPFPSVFVYLGLDAPRFAAVFGQFGRIVGAVHPQPAAVQLVLAKEV